MYLIIQLPKLTVQKCNINGVKLKLDFDTRKNMSAFAYFTAKINRKIGKIIDKINDLLSMRKIARNWVDVVLFRMGLKKTLIIKFRDGKSVYFKDMKEYFDFWKLDDCSSESLKASIKVMDRMYKWLDVKAKDVVDVGAYIGDSAICFALRGAKHVYAFEPYPYSYNIAKKNIRLNHLGNKITLFNEGCGKSGFVTIKEDYENTVGTDLKNFQKGKKVRVESLDEIVKRFNLKHAALKVDCEGCEYDLILNASDKILHAFDQIIIEYHYGYRNLVKKLRQAGFIVKYSLPAYFYNIEAEDSNKYEGLIYAKAEC